MVRTSGSASGERDLCQGGGPRVLARGVQAGATSAGPTGEELLGALSVAAHGHPRYTGDLDVWVLVDPDNSERLVRALDDSGSARSA